MFVQMVNEAPTKLGDVVMDYTKAIQGATNSLLFFFVMYLLPFFNAIT
jgi:hypothetical protein